MVHPLRSRRLRVAVIAVVALTVIVGVAVRRSTEAQPPVPEPPGLPQPAEFDTALWASALGGDRGIDTDDLRRLDDPANSDLGPDAPAAGQTARATVEAELTGAGRDRFDGYWPPGNTSSDKTAFCTAPNIAATSPMRLPVTGASVWSKALVVWKASCPQPLSDGWQVTYVYLEKLGEHWEPRREALVPAPPLSQAVFAVPDDSLLGTINGCVTRTGLRARLEVTYAFAELCSAASAAGVRPEVSDAWRSAAEQRDRFQAAVEHYGSEDQARRRVAFSDGRYCESRHCAGTALDLRPDPEVLRWLGTQVACTNLSGVLRRTSEPCNPGEVPVRRHTTYGFTQPIGEDPGHLEYGGELARVDDCAPPAAGIPEIITAVWRCRLRATGMASTDIDDVARSAVTVARCASGLDPSAVAFAGRYRNEPSPVDGRAHDETGLFMLTGAWADIWVPGGRARVTDPVANADGAARFWVSERSFGRNGWGPFPCAAGVTPN